MWHLDRSVLALSNTRAKAHFLVWMRSEFPLPQLATDSGWASQHLDWDPAICVLFLCHDSSLRAACWLHGSIVFWCLVLLHNRNSQRETPFMADVSCKYFSIYAVHRNMVALTDLGFFIYFGMMKKKKDYFFSIHNLCECSVISVYDVLSCSRENSITLHWYSFYNWFAICYWIYTFGPTPSSKHMFDLLLVFLFSSLLLLGQFSGA